MGKSLFDIRHQKIANNPDWREDAGWNRFEENREHSSLQEFPTDKLTPEQELKLSKRIKKKDESAVTELVMANIRESVVYLRKVCRGEFSDAELVSLSYGSLMKQAVRFRPGKVRFFAYCKAGLRGSISRHWATLDVVKKSGSHIEWSVACGDTEHAHTARSGTGHHGRKPSCHPDLMDACETSEIEGVVEPEFDKIDVKEKWAALQKVIANRLDDREKMILTLAYQNGYNFKEIGDLLGVSKSYIQAIHAKCLRKLKAGLLITGIE